MSGGFFRGTSADQDTRFSNKQAKLLKTQKFPSELDHPVDMKKVQMEVMKPWIATRVTELLGFEDEVLINFIFGLLDAKVVDGKQIQIQLTGFMEKNTPKFMRELWGHLLSAQQNASGVPQQFLDAKAEEIIKKKAESDRIVQEIQRKREKEANEQQLLDQQKRKDQKPMTDDKRVGESKRGSESKERRTRKSGFDENSPSIRKSPRSRSISPSRRSYRATSRSLSPRRASRSPALRRSISPMRRRHRSPRRSPPRRRRSPYYPRRRSPDPSRRRRSPHSRRRSPELAPRRSASPARRRRSPPSPLDRRPLSPSPLPPPSPRRSSPQRKRSSSPARSGSPSWDTEQPGRVSRSNRDGYKNSRDQERSSVEHTNGRARAEQSDAKRKGPNSIAVHVSERTLGPASSPENSPATSRLKSPRNSAYYKRSPAYKRHRSISESPVRPVGKQSSRHDTSEESVEEEPPTRTRGREVTRKHTNDASVSPEDRRYSTKQKARDAFTPDYIAYPERHQSGKQSIREAYHSPDRIRKEPQEKKHSNGKGYESEDELKYGPDPDPVMVKGKKSDNGLDSDDMEKHGRSHDREKKRHKKSHKHRKYSDESSESEASDESEREIARRRRKEEKRRLKREEKRQRREEKQRGKKKVSSTATPPSDADMREGSEEAGESEKQKRLEIELKERALQSFRAKKTAATH